MDKEMYVGMVYWHQRGRNIYEDILEPVWNWTWHAVLRF